ncbi:hypothetical protein ACUH89_03040 [Dermabacteraceae bacterium P13264]
MSQEKWPRKITALDVSESLLKALLITGVGLYVIFADLNIGFATIYQNWLLGGATTLLGVSMFASEARDFSDYRRRR